MIGWLDEWLNGWKECLMIKIMLMNGAEKIKNEIVSFRLRKSLKANYRERVAVKNDGQA